MPTVEKTSGGRVYLRALDRAVQAGDQVDVSDGLADYLVDERGDFEIVDEGSDGEAEDGEGAPDPVTFDVSETIDAGMCPWCDDYEGENVGQHASSAHPDEWDAYKEG